MIINSIGIYKHSLPPPRNHHKEKGNTKKKHIMVNILYKLNDFA